MNQNRTKLLACLSVVIALATILSGGCSPRGSEVQTPEELKGARDFLIIGYLSGGRFENEQQSLDAHIESVTDVNFAFINPTDDGSGDIAALTEAQTKSLANLVAMAKRYDRRVLLSFGGWRGEDLGVDEAYEKIAVSDSARESFIKNMVEMVETYEVGGIDLDWEYPRVDTKERKYAQEYAVFVHELAEALHAKGKILTAAVIAVKDKPTDEGDGAAYLDSVLKDLDLVNLMAYDETNADHSSYEHAEASLHYWIDERGLDPSKAVLGLPIYARPNWVSYREIIANYGKDQSLQDSYVDRKTNVEGFYNSIPTIKKKTRLAMDRGLAGVMFWELPWDTDGDEAELSLIKAAREVVDDANVFSRK